MKRIARACLTNTTQYMVLGMLFVLFTQFTTDQSFINSQLRNSRVATAKYSKDDELRREFQAQGLSYPPQELYFRAFKKEGIFEVWVADWSGYYKKFRDYTVCALPGGLGPKRVRGDHQIPEGFYHIDEFNPQSNYFLSLGINYPNKSDRAFGGTGGDIYIHGACKTVGCLPLSDEKIMEVYWLSVLAKGSGQSRIPVHIFPYKFDNYVFDSEERVNYGAKVARFWDNIRQGYDWFERNRTVPTVSVGSRGQYNFR